MSRQAATISWRWPADRYDCIDLTSSSSTSSSDHLGKLVEVLFQDHNPFQTPQQNDDAIKRFEIGYQHAVEVEDLLGTDAGIHGRLVEDVLGRT